MRAYLPANGPQSRPPITAVVNASVIDQLRNVLSHGDYVHVAEQLNDPSDVKNILELMLFLLLKDYFSSSDTNVDTNRRARRLMSKIISRFPALPRSLLLTGLSMPGDRDSVGESGFGRVFKSEHEGKTVALKVLQTTATSDVRCSINPFRFRRSFLSIQKQVVCRAALVWRSVQHTSVLPFLGIYENEAAGHSFLVLPHMTNCTLSQWRKKQAPPFPDIDQRVRLLS